jgi:hypothetical protein
VKKKLPILLIIIAMVASIILLVPSQISATNGCHGLPDWDQIEEHLTIDVDKGSASTPTAFEVCATDAPEGEWPYTFFVLKYSGTIEELDCEPNPESFIVYMAGSDFDIYYEGDVDCDYFDEVELENGHYYALIFVWEDMDGLEAIIGAGVGFTDIITPGPITSLAQNLEDLVAWNYKEFKIGGTKAAAPEPEPEPVPEPWVRGDHDMVCYQVWVNDNDCFEFVFWYEYADNNHVFIYDEGGNEVFSIDMPYQDASFEACLADGTYTVKTYHDQPEPLQEFVIAK